MKKSTSKGAWLDGKGNDGDTANSMGRPRLCEVPLYIVAAIAVVRNFSQTWMAQCIQYGPNPGLPKTVSGGVNTVAATLVGCVCFGSRLVRSTIASSPLLLQSCSRLQICPSPYLPRPAAASENHQSHDARCVRRRQIVSGWPAQSVEHISVPGERQLSTAGQYVIVLPGAPRQNGMWLSQCCG